jgi:hypothetical protein
VHTQHRRRRRDVWRRRECGVEPSTDATSCMEAAAAAHLPVAHSRRRRRVGRLESGEGEGGGGVVAAAHVPGGGGGGAESWTPGSCSSTRSFCRPGSSSFSTELQPGPAGPNFSQPLDQIILLIFVEE